MNQIISSLAAALFLALGAWQVYSIPALLCLSLACAVAWVSHIPELSIEWQLRMIRLGLFLYVAAFIFVIHAWSLHP